MTMYSYKWSWLTVVELSINMQRTSAIEASLEQDWLSSQSLSESALIFLTLTTCFFWGIMANFDIIARENSCKISRAPYGGRLIFYNAGRPIFSYTDAGRRPYDMWPRKRKFLKIVRCPGDYQIRRCTSLKSYDVNFICDHSISLAPYYMKLLLRMHLFIRFRPHAYTH